MTSPNFIAGEIPIAIRGPLNGYSPIPAFPVMLTTPRGIAGGSVSGSTESFVSQPNVQISERVRKTTGKVMMCLHKHEFVSFQNMYGSGFCEFNFNENQSPERKHCAS